VGVGITAAVLLISRSGDEIPSGPADAPIALPKDVLGLGPQAQNDTTQTAEWSLLARRAGNGATVVGRAYGGPSPARTIRIVAGRTDLTDKLELAWRADAGHLVGETKATCTNNVTIGERTQVRPTVMLCWRTTSTFSVYSLIIDPKSKGVTDADGAAAVDVAWRAAVKGA